MSKRKVAVALVATVIIIAIIAFAYFSLKPESKGELHLVNFKWTDNHPLFGSPYIHVEGTIFNSGERNAGEVKLVIRIYDPQNTLLKTETLDIGDIASKTYQNISVDIPYSGYAYKVEAELQWKPYG